LDHVIGGSSREGKDGEKKGHETKIIYPFELIELKMASPARPGKALKQIADRRLNHAQN